LRSAKRSPNRLKAIAGDHRSSAHSRLVIEALVWLVMDVRALAASRAFALRKFAPVSRA
jgi:hypothetical protein